jgi:hypothetical protein
VHSISSRHQQEYENTYEAWEALNAKWNKTNVDILVDVNQEFWEYKLTSDSDDPSELIHKLELIKKRLTIWHSTQRITIT